VRFWQVHAPRDAEVPVPLGPEQAALRWAACGASEAADSKMPARPGCFAGALCFPCPNRNLNKNLRSLLDQTAARFTSSANPRRSKHASWASQSVCFI